MDNNEKRIEELANRYHEMLSQVNLPEMKVEELLDLVDYYSNLEMEFDAELYKRIAVLKYPTHPDVLLMCAHWEADSGNWSLVKKIKSVMDTNVYDDALFAMEENLRMMNPEKAFSKMMATVKPTGETMDSDFLYDSAELFRDFGYMSYALDCLAQIPTSYPSYSQVYELSAECYFFMTHFEEALQALDKAIDANPFDEYLWTQTALVYYKMEKFDKAMDALEYSLAIAKDNPRALHLKAILKHYKDDQFGVAAESYQRQDYAAMLETGDLDFNRKDYIEAGAHYSLAGYFCPRGNRDRLQIAFKDAQTRVMCRDAKSGVQTLLAAQNQGFDLWPYAFELMVLLLKTGNLELVPSLLLPVMRIDRMSALRLEQLAVELSSAHCFCEAKEVWEMIFKREKELSPVYLQLLETARREMEGEE